MRYIPKAPSDASSKCIERFISQQMQARSSGSAWGECRVDYRHFPGGSELRELLISEQKGLCAYTGAGIDEKGIGGLQPRNQQPPREGHWFMPHIEHLKSQRQCKEELVARGGIVGRDVGEDLASANMVAALAVQGMPREHFGAVSRGDHPLAIVPTDPSCGTAFVFWEDGQISGMGTEADETIRLLKLDHPTLEDWRRGAIRGFLPKGSSTPVEELKKIVAKLRDESLEHLPAFAFVVEQVAEALLVQKVKRGE